MASMSHFIRAVPIKIDDKFDHFQPKTNIFVFLFEFVVCGKTCSLPDNCGLWPGDETLLGFGSQLLI